MCRRVTKWFLFVLIVLIPNILMSQSLSEEERNKLDPRFHAIIADRIQTLQKAAMAPRVKALTVNENDEEIYGAIIYTTDPDALRAEGIQVNSVLPNFITTRVTSSDLVYLVKMNGVKYIDAGKILYPLNDVATAWIGADLLHAGYVNNTPFMGKDVIVCIIDTGIDWEHLDFRDPATNTQSRILYIWDQTINPTGGENSPSETGCHYGVEYTKTHIEDEIDGSPANFVRERDTYGHGTHVTGTAAGNGTALSIKKYTGVAPEADIIMVKAGDGTFPVTNIIDGLSYARQKAAALGKPIVVNMSLGSSSGPHDGTNHKDIATNAFTNSAPGRVVVVSAGNEGNTDIHTSGTIAAGQSIQIRLTVRDYTPETGEDNDDFSFDVWFEGNGDILANLTSPNGFNNTQRSNGYNIKNTNDGTISINNAVFINNEDRFIQGKVFDGNAAKTPAQGDWTLQLTNNSSHSIDYDFWLHDADIGSDNSEVILIGGDSRRTLNNTAHNAIVVGSYVHRWRWSDSNDSTWWGGAPDRTDNISTFSSRGPTRDNRQKPDITAPGDKMASSTSKDTNPSNRRILPGQKHHVEQGTSMSSPVVAGAVALLLEQNPGLSVDNIRNIITQNADTDNYTGAVWNEQWGYGKLNIFQSMVKTLYPSSTADREILSYDGPGSGGIGTLDFMIAVRFAPSIDGEATGLFFHPYNNLSLSGPLKVEIWTDNNGSPGTKIGSTVNFDHNKVLPNSWNFVSLDGSNVTVTSGAEYHAVLYPTPEDTLVILHDGESPDGRSKYSLNSGQSWIEYDMDFRLRPVVSTERNNLATSVDIPFMASIPTESGLSQNYPNPFNPTTAFDYRLAINSEVSIRIYNILGRLVKKIVAEHQKAGHYTATWDGLDDHGRIVSSGIYFIRMKAGDFSKVRKLTLMR